MSGDTTPQDRLYFRQLLSGRDFAVDQPVARQMVNYAYLLGDRETGDAVLVDAPTRRGSSSRSSQPTA